MQTLTHYWSIEGLVFNNAQYAHRSVYAYTWCSVVIRSDVITDPTKMAVVHATLCLLKKTRKA